MNSTKGFALIELVVSFLIIGIFLNFVYFFFLQNLNLWKEKSNEVEIIQNARVVFEKIAREIRSAKALLNTEDRPSNAWQASFSLEDEEVTYELMEGMLYRRLAIKSPLLAKNYIINQAKNPTIDFFSFPSEKLVRINMILDAGNKKESKLASAIKMRGE